MRLDKENYSYSKQIIIVYEKNVNNVFVKSTQEIRNKLYELRKIKWLIEANIRTRQNVAAD